MNRMRLLMTKKISSSLVLQAGLKEIDILEKEFITIQPIENEKLSTKIKTLIDTKCVVAFTSKNAVDALAKHYDLRSTDWKIFCIEGATKDEVRKYFPEEKIRGTAKNADALAEVIISVSEEEELIFFCGNKRMNVLPDKLLSDSFNVEEVVVYETVLSPQKIVDAFDAVAFFSPSAVESFFSLNQVESAVVCLSVGNTTSTAIRQYTQNKVLTATKPTEESVLELATEIKNKI